MAKLTRAQMESVIRNRGSVLVDGRIVTTLSGLPGRATAPAEPSVTPPPATTPAADAETSASILDGTVDEVERALEGLSDAERLEQLYEEEAAAKNRKGVLAAIERRLEQLDGEPKE
jgi:hypothetical protein